MQKFLITTFISFCFCSCYNYNSITGSGNIKTETRQIENFEGIKTTGSIDIEIKNDKNRTVEVEADDNVLPYIITKVEDGLLNAYFKPNTSFHNAHAKVYVTAPAFKKLFVQGSGNISSKDMLKEWEQLELKISGSGDINAMIDAPVINADISGSGNITIEGKTRDLISKISGSGDLIGSQLKSENTNITVSGSGEAHVFASVALKAKVSGSGDVYYAGNPSSPEISKSGSGSVQPEK